MCACTAHAHAHPTDSQARGDTLSGDMLTELTSSREVITSTEPVSSGEPPTYWSKTCACSDSETNRELQFGIKMLQILEKVLDLYS